MAKIIRLNSKQMLKAVQSTVNNVLNESLMDEFSGFRTTVPIIIDHSHEDMNGRKIYGIKCEDIDIEFDLYMDVKSWGIRGNALQSIRGPKTIHLVIELEPLTDDDSEEYIEHDIRIEDWSDFEIDYDGNDDDFIKTINYIMIPLDKGFFPERIIVHPFDNY